MPNTIIAFYCLCADTLLAFQHKEDIQCNMSDAEVMTTAFVAIRFFRGNFQQARHFLASHGYIKRMLSLSRFLRRLARIRSLFVRLLHALAAHFKSLNSSSTYVIDSFPIAVCDNIRIPKSKLYPEEKYRGYCASKRRYFYGVKIFLMCTQEGEPIEIFLSPGSMGDVQALHVFEFDLPSGSVVYGDAAFTDYGLEDLLLESCGISLKPMRKKNAKRQEARHMAYLQAVGRKRVETAGSLIERLLPKSIHAVTREGFEFKVFLFAFIAGLNHLF